MEREKILEVKHLKQYFKHGVGSGKYVIKAVDDVSFDIYNGEVFGLVGESGCGKTTTGRTIIKLYDATDGEVYFKGERIGGGIKTFIDNIKDARAKAKLEILEFNPKKWEEYLIKKEAKDLKAQMPNKDKEQLAKILSDKKTKLAELAQDATDNPAKYEVKPESTEKIDKIKEDLKTYVDKQKEDIKSLKDDNSFKGQTVKTMKNIQMIFQDPIASLNPRMTVREIIAEGLIIDGMKDKKLLDEKVFEILQIVGLLPEHAFRYPHEFSGGQRQRIGIARALIVEPALLIADEPISALDVSIQAQVINLLKELQKKFGLTTLFIAHDLSVVKYFSDRIAVMYYGKMVELATSEKLFAHPLHPYTKSLLSAIPLPDPNYEKERVRFNYDPSTHNYGPGSMPEFIEIEPEHFILASPEELEQYKEEIKKADFKVKK